MKLDRAAPPIDEIRQRLRYEPKTGHFYAASIAVSAMFFGLSFTRAWIIRGIFRGLE